MAGGNWFPHKPFRGGESTSGWSGFSGQAGSVEFSGMSGYSGAVPAFQFTNRAYKTLDEERHALADLVYPDPQFVPNPLAPDSELVLSLEGNTKYFISGTLFVELYKWDWSGSYGTIDVPSQWKYTGTVDNISIGFVGVGQVMAGYAVSNRWTAINTTFNQYATPNWQFLWGGDEASSTTILHQLNGTIETTSSGILSFCWQPYNNYQGDPAPGYHFVLNRGSYIQAENLGGAASGMSGYSGRDGILRVGTWIGI